MTSAYENNDSAQDAHHAALQKHASSFIFYTVQQGDTSIPTICAKLIEEHTGHEATKSQLDALVADAYSRNHLATPTERAVHFGEHLYFQYPVMAQNEPAKPSNRHPVHHEKSQSATERKPAPPAAQTTVLKESPRATYGCSAYETSVVGDWVEKNEVGKLSFTAFTPNDNGNGVSAGKMQWNQKKGKLPDLIKAFHDADAKKFDTIFGKNSKNALNEEWVRHADFTQGELKNELIESLSAFSYVQLRMQNEQVQSACGLAKESQLTALRGVGVIADLVNHVGPNRTRHILQKVPGPDKASQSQRIDDLEKLAKRYSTSRINSIHDNVTQMWKK